ncbi:UDP-N-acetylglucosamine 2-epimerase [Humisphaera borealis]|uniref:UDP-N-acetylglucosamine 2-epimerase (Hydrolyzing) n=1 Tax=Humisphaera borealis TaxID=2807512 RepID=A0A7M2X150_9BACT|nr:UDP-N-acetylglucosamine 2-epimerase [Humisphaera borealis]QOV91399.1 UDP-N-acetylglucosamine 2-epimerase (hydrolyzing) [Humisphaera borealis]
MAKLLRRNVCFVTGTRAEYGLMARTLEAIETHPSLKLQVIATGMHLDRSRGSTVDQIRYPKEGVSAIVPWPPVKDAAGTAVATGQAMARLAEQYKRLRTDVALVVGDRVEAFAAAGAANVSGLCVAHVHGGDRALGLVDDSLRHAVTKLSHLHFPATAESARRLIRLGEDPWRVHRVGSPGLDGITRDAAAKTDVAAVSGTSGPFLLVSLHPASDDPTVEAVRANTVLRAVQGSAFASAVVVYPNNDPGSAGIVKHYRRVARSHPVGGSSNGPSIRFHPNLSRALWLGLVRDAVALVGNSSSGIIEAASFGTPVVDIGPRQQGRERGKNVAHCGYETGEILALLRTIWHRGNPIRFPRRNIYGDGKAANKIAARLADATLDDRLIRKLIAY